MTRLNYDCKRSDIEHSWNMIREHGHILKHHKRRLLDDLLEIVQVQNYKAGKRLADVHGSINERARLQARLVGAVDDNGMTRKHQAGRDCDGYSFHWSYKVSANLFALWREIERDYAWADGPIKVWLEHPCIEEQLQAEFDEY